MASDVTAQPDRVLVDLETNAIQLIAGDGDDFPDSGERRPALLDIAEGGRLIGLELLESVAGLPNYVELEPMMGGLTRTGEISVTVWPKPDQGVWRIDIPRHGEGYEITYPSGNQ
jgi:hypothetical protein